jgi:hypothetical protein
MRHLGDTSKGSHPGTNRLAEAKQYFNDFNCAEVCVLTEIL